MFSLNTHKNKVLGISFVLVLCLTIFTASPISTTFSADGTTGSRKASPLSTSYSSGANYVWTWMSGNKTEGQNGVYGTKGVPDTANYPGGRYASVSWTDTDGNLWLFGGHGYPASGGYSHLNDLWRYDVSSGIWTWMKGNDTIDENGVYGTKGVPNKANYPGGRFYPATWIDLEGNLWLFGGHGYPASGGTTSLNDLWKYNIASNMWTWISGNDTSYEYGVYGTKGEPNPTNYPGSRYSSAYSTDLSGNFWLFGGFGLNSSAFGNLNDLWRYNITSAMWTWMSGNDTIDENGVYGTKGVPNKANYPGGRRVSFSWTDLEGNFLVSGGIGHAATGTDRDLNDLWRYNTTSGMWTWLSGNDTTDEYGVYGTKRVPNKANYPGGRYGAVSRTDLDGNLWLCGGKGYAAAGSEGQLNDLWRYNITSDLWTWISGNDTIEENGIYGTKGESNVANYLGSRHVYTSWLDMEGNLWVFGGQGYAESGGLGWLNDLWRCKLPSAEKSQTVGQIPSTGDDDDDDDDDEEQAIPFGNYYILFIMVGIVGGVMYYKKKHSILKDR